MGKNFLMRIIFHSFHKELLVGVVLLPSENLRELCFSQHYRAISAVMRIALGVQNSKANSTMFSCNAIRSCEPSAVNFPSACF